MREGSARLLAAAKHRAQSLEAARALLTSNERMSVYMAELQNRRRDPIKKPWFVHAVICRDDEQSEGETPMTQLLFYCYIRVLDKFILYVLWKKFFFKYKHTLNIIRKIIKDYNIISK